MMEFSARTVSRLAGFQKPWMLNHLEREGIFVREKNSEPHHGKRKSYGFRDLIILRAINRLLALGARPKRVKEAISGFEKSCKFPSSSDELLTFAQKSTYFIVTKESVYFSSIDGLVDLARGGQLAFAFTVDTAIAIGPVASAVIELEQRQRRDLPLGRAIVEAAAKRHSL